jgi:hypothetical protein
MSVLGPNDPRGVVRRAGPADAARVAAVRPRSLPNADAVILGTGEIGFRIVHGSKEEEAFLADLSDLPVGLRPGDVVGPRRAPRRGL